MPTEAIIALQNTLVDLWRFGKGGYTVKYWEVEFECDDSWSISGIYAFFVNKETEPTAEDVKQVHGVYPNNNGLGNIVRINDITDDIEHYEGLPVDW